jgi:hypothetical protein
MHDQLKEWSNKLDKNKVKDFQIMMEYTKRPMLRFQEYNGNV